jgi:hypothetical protein
VVPGGASGAGALVAFSAGLHGAVGVQRLGGLAGACGLRRKRARHGGGSERSGG